MAAVPSFAVDNAAETICNASSKSPARHSYAHTMVEKELGLQLDTNTVKIPEAATIGVSLGTEQH